MGTDVVITDYDREQYARELWNMSDVELKNYMSRKSLEGMQLDFRLPTSKIKANQILKEVKLAGEVLEERPKRKAILEQWEKDLTSRREKAILNLPVSSSANGQLIAAIIEEEGASSAEEINTWCEELEAFDLEEIQTMLSALVEEGVLYQDEDQKYNLQQILTESLFPDDPVKWAVEKGRRTGGIPKYHRSYTLLLTLIHYHRRPVYPEELYLDIEKKTGISGSYIYLGFEDFTNDDYDMSNRDINYRLKQMEKCGILTQSDGHYYFPMLGERKETNT